MAAEPRPAEAAAELSGWRWYYARAVFPVVLGGALVTSGWIVLRADGWRPGIMLTIAAAALAIILSERALPLHRAWNQSRGDVKTDCVHLLVSNGVLPELYKAGLQLLLLPVALALGAALSSSATAGLWPSRSPFALQVALALVVAELGQYWAHRLGHARELLWRLHATHHSPERLYWLNAGREHPLGLLLLFGASVAPLLLLGAGEDILIMYTVFTAVHGLFQHCNIDVRLGPLNWIFSMAELHRWHHHPDPAIGNHNFGANLILWDVVFGTRYLPRAPPPETVGIGALPSFPTDYLGQLAAPFRWRRLHEPRAPRSP